MSKEKTMQVSNLFKVASIGVLLLGLNVPNAMAGGTNRDENTSATPGEKATTTKSATDQQHNRRKGTTKTDSLKTPTRPSDTSRSSSSGSSSNDMSNTDSSSGSSNTGSTGSSGSSSDMSNSSSSS